MVRIASSNKKYDEAQTEVGNILEEIEQIIRKNETDKLISYHAYGQKYTEFKLCSNKYSITG